MRFRGQSVSRLYYRDQRVSALYWRGMRIWLADAESSPLRKGQLALHATSTAFRAVNVHLFTGQLHVHGTGLTTQQSRALAKGSLQFQRKTGTFYFTAGLANGTLNLVRESATFNFDNTLTRGNLHITGNTGTFSLIAVGIPIGLLLSITG